MTSTHEEPNQQIPEQTEVAGDGSRQQATIDKEILITQMALDTEKLTALAVIKREQFDRQAASKRVEFDLQAEAQRVKFDQQTQTDRAQFIAQARSDQEQFELQAALDAERLLDSAYQILVNSKAAIVLLEEALALKPSALIKQKIHEALELLRD